MTFRKVFIIVSFVTMFLLVANSIYAGTWTEDFGRGNYNGWRLIRGTENHRAEISVECCSILMYYIIR
ncbi:MAG: hypothetical protein AAB116_25055 [Candidatus Poribacteria bacterium]